MPPRRRRLLGPARALLAGALALAGLPGCGQKGPLYLPGDTAPRPRVLVPHAAPAASAAASAPASAP